MAYEIRIDGRIIWTCETPEAAIERVRAELRRAPDVEPEVFDTATGRPLTPAASRGWREHLANNMGY